MHGMQLHNQYLTKQIHVRTADGYHDNTNFIPHKSQGRVTHHLILCLELRLFGWGLTALVTQNRSYRACLELR